MTGLHPTRYRRRWLAVLVIAVSSGITSAAGAQAGSAISGDPVAGRRLFAERGCVRCHAIWGNGGTLGPDFATVGAGRSLQQLAGLFWNHTPRMIRTVRSRGFDWPAFTEQDLANIISYIYYVKLFDEPGDATLGERWFLEKRCSACHSVGGSGGHVGPPLDGYARYNAPILLAQAMWNHGPAMRARQSAERVPPPVFLGREIADIQEYIRERSNLRERRLVLLQPPNPDNGARLYVSKRCARCHGSDGRGSSAAPSLRSAVRRLRVSEIAGKLWNHSANMAAAMQAQGLPFPRFDGNEMADVIAYLYYLPFYDRGGNRQTGGQLFAQKGCATCHNLEGQPSAGPDLTQSSAVLTPLGLATAMWDHAPAMYDRMQSADTEWPRFEGDEMRDLALYLRSLASERRR